MRTGGINAEGAIFAASGKGRSNKKVQAAVKGFMSVKEWLDEMGAFNSMNRLAMLIGQCAHESAGFQRCEEGLSYSSKRLTQVWPSRYPTMDAAFPYARNPRRLANHTYADRMGNGSAGTGDGYRFRGRGWIQLTGRSNYWARGKALGMDLEGNPDLAIKPGVRWQIAASYCANRKRQGLTCFEWGDKGNHSMTTRIINGGTHGLEDRISRIQRALEELV
jgi:putative chitinase